MHVELTPAAAVLLVFLAALFFHDVATLRKNRRLLRLQLGVFVVGGLLIVMPDMARRLASAVGIGRGVDFVLYFLVIALVREALLSRRRRHEEQARVTELVRAFAMSSARGVVVNAETDSAAVKVAAQPGQSASPPAGPLASRDESAG